MEPYDTKRKWNYSFKLCCRKLTHFRLVADFWWLKTVMHFLDQTSKGSNCTHSFAFAIVRMLIFDNVIIIQAFSCTQNITHCDHEHRQWYANLQGLVVFPSNFEWQVHQRAQSSLAVNGDNNMHEGINIFPTGPGFVTVSERLVKNQTLWRVVTKQVGQM